MTYTGMKVLMQVCSTFNSFKGTLTLAFEVHSYKATTADLYGTLINFYRPRIRNNYEDAAFSFAGSKIWEKFSL